MGSKAYARPGRTGSRTGREQRLALAPFDRLSWPRCRRCGDFRGYLHRSLRGSGNRGWSRHAGFGDERELVVDAELWVRQRHLVLGDLAHDIPAVNGIALTDQ